MAAFMPLWEMTLIAPQYPSGLHLYAYGTHMEGDLREINALNHYIGMTPIADGVFVELQYLRWALLGIAALLVLAAVLRRARWVAAIPLLGMAALAAGGIGVMRYRLWQFGHQLDPQAAITIDPFTPPMVGLNQIAQFATYSYFSWGFFLPLVAGVLAALVVLADRRKPRPPVRRAMLVAA